MQPTRHFDITPGGLMAYQDIVEVQRSSTLRARVTACAATEDLPDPENWVASREWKIAATPGWGDAWASGRAVYPDEDLGVKNDVISDSMILSGVQAIVADEQPA